MTDDGQLVPAIVQLERFAKNWTTTSWELSQSDEIDGITVKLRNYGCTGNIFKCQRDSDNEDDDSDLIR